MIMKTLKILRIKSKLSYQDMANILHISKTYYWQLENNKRRLFYSQAIEIAKIFHLKPDDIFYQDLI